MPTGRPQTSTTNGSNTTRSLRDQNCVGCRADDRHYEEIRDLCRDKLGSLSPNGPADAYSYVARSSALTGTTGVTKERVYPESDTGDVLVYLAGPSGAISGADRDAAEEAILEWATPLCITPTVASAVNLPVPVSYSLYVYRSVGEEEGDIEDAVEDALEAFFASTQVRIGGDIIPPAATGKLYRSLISDKIRSVYPNHTFRVELTLPAGDTTVANNQIPTLGAITHDVHLVDDPS